MKNSNILLNVRSVFINLYKFNVSVSMSLNEAHGIKLNKQEGEIDVVKEVFKGDQALADEIMTLEDIE